jgi:rubredoxin
MFDQNAQYGAPQYGANPGYVYQGMTPQQQVKQTNVLTPEQIKQLQQNQEQFSLSITQEEYWRGICNHRTADGLSDALVEDPNTGCVTCTICGYTFKPLDPNVSSDTIKDSVEVIIDILQTIKLLFIDLPAEAAKEYFQIIPLIEKIPNLFEYAAKNMARHENFGWTYNNRNMGAAAMLKNLQAAFGGGMMGGFGAPMGQPMGAPVMGQPQPNPAMYAGTATPGANAFGYPGASMTPGYTPGAPGFSYQPDPGVATSPVQPTTPEPAPEADPGKEVKVTAKVEA